MKVASPIVVRRIQGHSMVPVLPPNTLVIGLGWNRSYQAGDVIIFEHNGRERIKRIQEVLGDGSLFVVGEHSETSKDSRHFGAIDPRNVLARVIWPKVNIL